MARDLPEGYFAFPTDSEPRAFWRCPDCGLVRLEEFLPTFFGPRSCPMHRRKRDKKPNMVRFEILVAEPAPRQPGKGGRIARIYLRLGEGSKLHIYSGHGGEINAPEPIAACGRRGGEMLRDVTPDRRDVCESCLTKAKP